MTGATVHQLDDDPAVLAVTSALDDCDHARLPVWMVAQIAVEAAREVLRDELNRQMQDEAANSPGT